MDKFLSSNLSLNLNGFPPGPGEKYCWGSITLDVSVWLVSLGMDPRSCTCQASILLLSYIFPALPQLCEGKRKGKKVSTVSLTV